MIETIIVVVVLVVALAGWLLGFLTGCWYKDRLYKASDVTDEQPVRLTPPVSIEVRDGCSASEAVNRAVDRAMNACHCAGRMIPKHVPAIGEVLICRKCGKEVLDVAL